jgi:hypothetical protein
MSRPGEDKKGAIVISKLRVEAQDWSAALADGKKD